MSGLACNLIILAIGYVIWLVLWLIKKTLCGDIDWDKIL